MFELYLWVMQNWDLITVFGILLIVLSLTGNITTTAREAKKGVKEAVTPLGFIIFLVLAYIAYQIYLSILVTL